MPWIVVTTVTREKQVWLNVDHCSRVRLPVTGEIGHAIIDLAEGRTQAVDETVEEVIAAIITATNS